MTARPILAVAVAALACGCGESTPAPRTVTVAASSDAARPATTPPPPVDRAADSRAARAALLTLADMPAGWVSPDDDRDDRDDSPTSCRGVRSFKRWITAKARSQRFVAPAGSPQISQLVTVLDTPRHAADAVSEATSAPARRCAGDRMEKSLKRSRAVGHVTTATVNVPPLGDSTSAVQITVPITSGGEEHPAAIFSIVATQIGRGVTMTQVFEAAESPRDHLVEDTAASAARRLRAALVD